MSKIVNDSNVDEIIKSNKIVLIDFNATWCGPCRMLSPIIDELSNENSDIVIGKLDVDDNKDTARKYGIRGIPTILYFKNGEIVDRSSGFKNKADIQNTINNLKN